MSDWTPGPPPVFSGPVFDYPADPPPPRPPWLTPVVIVGAAVAVIALVIAAVALIGPTTSGPSTITSTVAAPPPVTQVSTVTLTPPPPPPPPPPNTTVVVVPAPTQAPPPSVSTCLSLRNQANTDYSMTAEYATGYWVPQLSSKRPGLVADGITWDCDSILAEHLSLRATYTADLLWSGDWPNTYGHGDYWVTVASRTFTTAEGARQWCVDHGRDVPEHCYPVQIQ